MKNIEKFLLFSVLIVSCILLVSNFVSAADEYVPDQIIVKLKQNVATTAETIGKVANGFNSTVVRTDESANFTVLKLPVTATVDQAVAYYNNKKLGTVLRLGRFYQVFNPRIRFVSFNNFS